MPLKRCNKVGKSPLDRTKTFRQFSARLSSAYRLVQGMQRASSTYREVSST